jgi:hypothetical protein
MHSIDNIDKSILLQVLTESMKETRYPYKNTNITESI